MANNWNVAVTIKGIGADFAYGTLTSGTAVTVLMANTALPCLIWVNPFVGDTVTVSYQASVNAPAQPWPNGTSGGVTSYSDLILEAPVYAIIFQRTAGSGTTSAYGITS